MSGRKIVLPAVLVASMALACSGDYEIPLKHGYFIARVWSGAFILVAPNSRVLTGPTIVGYQVSGDLVFGHVRLSEEGNKETWFLVDMKTRQAEVGLTGAEWRRRLAASGIGDVHLKQPSRWDKLW